MIDLIVGVLVAGGGYLAVRHFRHHDEQHRAADATGLEPERDLSHLPVTLQHTALWTLADGGFERRVLHGRRARTDGDVDVTTFDLETLRDRRGEWAWLPVDDPFRIGEVVSVVACVVDRTMPHVLFKHAGGGDDLRGDTVLDRGLPIHPGDNRGMKLAREVLALGKSYAAEMPPTLPTEHATATLPIGWRAYTKTADYLRPLLDRGFAETLAATSRRDLVIELLDALILIYPAQREVVGPDALADLTTTALSLVDGILAATRPLTARGLTT